MNGHTEIQAELHAGDEIAIGGCLLRVEAQGALAELRVLKGPDEGRTFPLVSSGVLGRGVNASVALLDMKCSREHCRVEKRDDGGPRRPRLHERDEAERGQARDQRGREVDKTGDRLRLGATVVEFRLAAANYFRPLPSSGSVNKATPAPVPPPTGGVFEIDLEALDVVPPPAPARRDARPTVRR